MRRMRELIRRIGIEWALGTRMMVKEVHTIRDVNINMEETLVPLHPTTHLAHQLCPSPVGRETQEGHYQKEADG